MTQTTTTGMPRGAVSCSGRRVHPGGEDLSHVGLVVWQSAFVLAELLLRQPPFGQWHDVRVIDLGTGTGTLWLSWCRPETCLAKTQNSACPSV